MDNGEVIPNLDKPWEFAGVRMYEWFAGVAFAMVTNELFFTSATSSMPLLIASIVLTGYALSRARRCFPDGTRGFTNWCSTKLGFPPKTIPIPSELQPIWSGAPIRRIKSDTLYMQLGFDEFFSSKKEEKMREQEGRL